jgi:hypothetical protein
MKHEVCASFFGIGGTSWKEEVLLHDGSKLIVTRSVEHGGRHEIGQRPSIKNESLTFTSPTTDERVTWKNEFSEDVGIADFMPLALDLFHGVAYVVTTPAGCISYNKWGRPNPPYVVFSYQNKTWQRITLQELPAEIKTPNIIVSSPDTEVEKLGRNLITVELIRRANSELTQPEYRTILREPITNAGGSRCDKMVPDSKGGWLGLDWFSDQPTYEACTKFCANKNVSPEHCPCTTLFKGK